MGAHYSHAPPAIGEIANKMLTKLWSFASECYARPGVAEACLHAQDDYAIDVNMLLAAAWLAERGASWQPEDIVALTKLCADWRSQCIAPLRAVRRYLKQNIGADDMYMRTKALELEAESHQLHLIETMLIDFYGSEASKDETLEQNLRTYFDTLPNAALIDPTLATTLAMLIGSAAK